MSKIWLKTKKVFPKPYVVLSGPPEVMERGVVGLEPGECVEVCRLDSSKQVHYYVYRVANIDGKIQETLLEHFILENWS